MAGSMYGLDERHVLQQAGKTPEDGIGARASLPPSNFSDTDVGSGTRDPAVPLTGVAKPSLVTCVHSFWVNALKGRSKTWEGNVEQTGEGGKERAGYLGNSD